MRENLKSPGANELPAGSWFELVCWEDDAEDELDELYAEAG